MPWRGLLVAGDGERGTADVFATANGTMARAKRVTSASGAASFCRAPAFAFASVFCFWARPAFAERVARFFLLAPHTFSLFSRGVGLGYGDNVLVHHGLVSPTPAKKGGTVRARAPAKLLGVGKVLRGRALTGSRSD